ncbi:MAG: O-succinylhomoserine sulfhydrylase, partial [Alphaproteobacteria bacterium]
MASKSKNWRPQTQAVRGGLTRSEFGETAEALYLTSGFVYDSAETVEARFLGEDDGFVYSRFGNPTVAMFEERMRLLEGTEACKATATGMAAVNASLFAALSAGDHVVAAKALFGSCRYILEDLLPRFGVETTLVEGTDLAAWKAAAKPNTKLFFLESPTNPALEVIDMQAVADIAHENNARLCVDNVFATPVLQRPLEFGADIVVYSATKHIDGQGRVLGGAVLGTEEYIMEELLPYIRNTGPSLSPFNAWVLLKSLETLDLRVNRHADNALAVANFLGDEAENVVKVLYPGRADHPQHTLAMQQMKKAGNVIAFEVPHGKDGAFRLLNALELIDISNNLGDAKSLITHPATTTHQKIGPEARAELGISDGMVRLSVGLEDAADVIDDLRHAL